MLLCSVHDIDPGMVLGASVLHPRRPDTELLRAGVALDAAMIDRLRKFDVAQVWVEHDATRDLDLAVLPRLDQSQVAVYQQLKSDLGKISSSTITTGQVQQYRQTITELVFQVTAGQKYARLGSVLAGAEGALFTHSANVAYLSILAGLELEQYIIRERPRMAPGNARDLVALGMGGMLHDIGKAFMPANDQHLHEVHQPSPEEWSNEYRAHPVAGYKLLHEARVPASAKHCVLHHHQRFDGQGWPQAKRGGDETILAGNDIHIFTRIVSAANVLDALLTDADGAHRPPVAALRDFASETYEGWFDPVVRDCILRKLPPFAIGAMVHLSDGRRAVVVSPNPSQPCRPVVRDLSPTTRTDSESSAVIDLNLRRDLHIVACAGEPVEDLLFEIPESDDAMAARIAAANAPEPDGRQEAQRLAG